MYLYNISLIIKTLLTVNCTIFFFIKKLFKIYILVYNGKNSKNNLKFSANIDVSEIGVMFTKFTAHNFFLIFLRMC